MYSNTLDIPEVSNISIFQKLQLLQDSTCDHMCPDSLKLSFSPTAAPRVRRNDLATSIIRAAPAKKRLHEHTKAAGKLSPEHAEVLRSEWTKRRRIKQTNEEKDKESKKREMIQMGYDYLRTFTFNPSSSCGTTGSPTNSIVGGPYGTC